MSSINGYRTGETPFSGSLWFQERYFLAALQQEVDRAREWNTPLCLILVQVPQCSRRVAHEFFAYAESEKGNAFFGLLSNGDYVVCLPYSGYSAGAAKRVSLTRALAEFGVTTGMAVLDEEESAAALLAVAAQDCQIATQEHFTVSAVPVIPNFRPGRDR